MRSFLRLRDELSSVLLWRELASLASTSPKKGGDHDSTRTLQRLVDTFPLRDTHSLYLKKWVRDGMKSDTPQSTSQNLGVLLHMCSNSTNPGDLEGLMDAIKYNKLELTESNHNILLLTMCKHGWINSIKTGFKWMIENDMTCRQGTLFSLARNSVRRKDFEFAVELMGDLLKQMQDRLNVFPEPFSMDVLVDGCVGGGGEGEKVVELVMEWYRIARLELSLEMASSITKWIKSMVRDHHIEETQILPDGQCQCCKEELTSANISKSSHSSLLMEVENIIVTMEKRQSLAVTPLNALKQIIKGEEFGSVIDGMNVMAMRKEMFNCDWLLEVAEKVVTMTKCPALIVLKWYCVPYFPLTSRNVSKDVVKKEFNNLYHSRGLHFFLVENSCDDDLYTLYGALASGDNTMLLSNDKMGDKRQKMPISKGVILEQWKRTHQIYPFLSQDKRLSLTVPVKFERIVQWYRCGDKWTIHLPCKDRNGAIKWLCIKPSTST